MPVPDPTTQPALTELADAPRFASPALSSSTDDEDETALARLADDGGPPPPESNGQEVFLAPMPAIPVAPAASAPIAIALPATPPSFEQRIRRLEDALAQLQEERGTETRITAHPAVPPPPSPSPPATPTATTSLFDAGKRLLGTAANAIAQAPSVSPAVPPPPSPDGGILWLLWDTWAEARAIVRMFVDPRYRLPWSSRIIPLFLLAAFLIPKKYWVPGAQIPILGDWLFSRAVDLLLAFVLFKWLGHEARRYRHMSPDLPPNLRL